VLWSAVVYESQCTTDKPSTIASRSRGDSHVPPDVRERFNSGLHLVPRIAKWYRNQLSLSGDIRELVSYGQSGLFDAASRYDASLGVPFRAFAQFRIRGAILDGVRELARLPRSVHERLRVLECANTYSELTSVGRAAGKDGQLLSEHLAGMVTAIATGLLCTPASPHGSVQKAHCDGNAIAIDPAASPEEQCLRAQLVARVIAAVNRLPAEEAHLIRCFYFQGKRLEDVAVECGSSKASMGRLHVRAIQRLTQRLAVDGAPS
jgi:RNA polymerase sigma factor for flagellar operon FliA